MGSAKRREARERVMVPKVRMRSARMRERSCDMIAATMTPVTPVGIKRTVVWMTLRPW